LRSTLSRRQLQGFVRQRCDCQPALAKRSAPTIATRIMSIEPKANAKAKVRSLTKPGVQFIAVSIGSRCTHPRKSFLNN
jgi:hypothetical protein